MKRMFSVIAASSILLAAGHAALAAPTPKIPTAIERPRPPISLIESLCVTPAPLFSENAADFGAALEIDRAAKKGSIVLQGKLLPAKSLDTLKTFGDLYSTAGAYPADLRSVADAIKGERIGVIFHFSGTSAAIVGQKASCAKTGADPRDFRCIVPIADAAVDEAKPVEEQAQTILEKYARTGAVSVTFAAAGCLATSTPFALKELFENPAMKDADRDGIPDTSDNCADTFNPDQGDADANDIGDACEEAPQAPSTAPLETIDTPTTPPPVPVGQARAVDAGGACALMPAAAASPTAALLFLLSLAPLILRRWR